MFNSRMWKRPISCLSRLFPLYIICAALPSSAFAHFEQEQASETAEDAARRGEERATAERIAKELQEAEEAKSNHLPNDPHYRNAYRPPPSFALVEQPFGASTQSGPAFLIIMVDYLIRPDGKLVRASVRRQHNPDVVSDVENEWMRMETLVRNKIGLLKWQPVMTQITPTEISLYFKAYPGKNYGNGKVGDIMLAPVAAADIARLTSLAPDDYAQGVMQVAELARAKRDVQMPELKDHSLPIKFTLLFNTKNRDQSGQKAFVSNMLERFPGTGPYTLTDESAPGYPMLGLHMEYERRDARLYLNAICDSAAKEGGPCAAIFVAGGDTDPMPNKSAGN